MAFIPLYLSTSAGGELVPSESGFSGAETPVHLQPSSIEGHQPIAIEGFRKFGKRELPHATPSNAPPRPRNPVFNFSHLPTGIETKEGSNTMQKILRRVATAERVAAKRSKTKDLKWFKKERKEQSQEQIQQLEIVRRELQQAKQAIKDDWELGPLAPRLDVGAWAGAKGAIHEVRFASSGRVSLAMRNRRCRWAGGAYNLNLAVGDRVVLVDGPEKGQIGKIARIDQEKAEVTLDGLNKVRNSQLLCRGFLGGNSSRLLTINLYRAISDCNRKYVCRPTPPPSTSNYPSPSPRSGSSTRSRTQRRAPRGTSSSTSWCTGTWYPIV